MSKLVRSGLGTQVNFMNLTRIAEIDLTLMNIMKLADYPEWLDQAANWFANQWGIPVEEAYRRQNIAKQLLDFARTDMKRAGFEKLYLVTELNDFYEKCGWTFLTTVQDDEGEPIKMYVADTL